MKDWFVIKWTSMLWLWLLAAAGLLIVPLWLSGLLGQSVVLGPALTMLPIQLPHHIDIHTSWQTRLLMTFLVLLIPMIVYSTLKCFRLNTLWMWLSLPIGWMFAYRAQVWQWYMVLLLLFMPLFSGAKFANRWLSYLPLALGVLWGVFLPLEWLQESGRLMYIFIGFLPLYFATLDLKDTAPVANWITILSGIIVTVSLLYQNLMLVF